MAEDPTDRQTFVIGDVHGHVSKLEALLREAGVQSHHTVVQLGDLGHYGTTQLQVADFEAWQYAQDNIDIVLWGNHDYAVFNRHHEYTGYREPFYETVHLMKVMRMRRRILMAYETHGFLLTHAGLHKAFMHQHVDPALKHDPRLFVEWVNRCEEEQDPPDAYRAVRDAISGRRGGGSPYGGILWRDAGEKLYPEFRQIFGHSAKDNKVRKYPSKTTGVSYCIDIGTAKNGRVAGMWLPSEEIIKVQAISPE